MGRYSKAKLAAKARAVAARNNRLSLHLELHPRLKLALDPDPHKVAMEICPEIVCKTEEPFLNEELRLAVNGQPEGLKIKPTPTENQQEIQAEVATSLEETPIEMPVPGQPTRQSRKSARCCEDVPKSKTKVRRPKPRCTAFSLWIDELQKQMAADPKPKPPVDFSYKQLQKKWSRLSRLQKNYWGHRAKLVNAGDKGKVIEKKLAKRRGKVEVQDVEKMIGSSKIPKKKEQLPRIEEKDDKAMELMVELLPVKNEDEEPSPKPVVLVYSAYTLWLLNFRRKVSPEMSDALGSGSKLAARLWEGLSMKEKIIWNNRAVQVNGMLRHGWETATTYVAVKRFVLGEKISKPKKTLKAAVEVDPLADITKSNEVSVQNIQKPPEEVNLMVPVSQANPVVVQQTELSTSSVEYPTQPVIIKQEPVPIPAEAVSRLKLISDSLNIVGDYLKECESPEVTNSVAWLVASLHSSLEPLSALAHGLNLPALQGNVEQLRAMFQRQKL